MRMAEASVVQISMALWGKREREAEWWAVSPG